MLNSLLICVCLMFDFFVILLGRGYLDCVVCFGLVDFVGFAVCLRLQ